MALQRIHLFESRSDAFDRYGVLQENVIIAALKAAPIDPVSISTSYGLGDLDRAHPQLTPLREVLDLTSSESIVRFPNRNYVLIRRFSPKEDNSRITAAPLFQKEMGDFVGIENHVNYLYRPGGNLSPSEATGLAAYLNSRWVDRYFRLSSGNTQVSATELRDLPMPPLSSISQIGARILNAGAVGEVSLVIQIVGDELDLPWESFGENGGHMSKIE